MVKLMLLRHAKAEWAEPGQRDYDRVLSQDGIEECQSIAAQMSQLGIKPDTIICSLAVRAKQTLEHIEPALTYNPAIEFERDLYATDAPGYLEIASASKSGGDIMLIGHNPMMEDLAYGLSKDGDQAALDAMNMGFRTCGLAIVRFDDPIKDALSQSGLLEAYLT
ncbi:MAG: histidine phosphatase family protein, partial [Pseudomonadota bacterium]